MSEFSKINIANYINNASSINGLSLLNNSSAVRPIIQGPAQKTNSSENKADAAWSRRIEQLPIDVANELNTYKNFGVFRSFAETYMEPPEATVNSEIPPKKGEGGANGPGNIAAGEVKYGEIKQPVKPTPGVGDHPGTPGVRSLFNKYSAVLTGNRDPGWENKSMSQNVRDLVYKTSDFRISSNAPLLDNPETRKVIREKSACTVKDLVTKSDQGFFGNARYSYADFMYCKHLGKVPNNYLITLRRYPAPITDSITPQGNFIQRKGVGKLNTLMPIGTMISWLGVSGNDMKSILKYEYTMPFEEKNAKWEDVKQEGGTKGILNHMQALVNPVSRNMINKGMALPIAQGPLSEFLNPGDGYPLPDAHRDQTKVYGPIDAIKSTYMRSDKGINHNQQFQVVFEYELKAYNGINPRQAMLDLLASIFSVTYTTGSFWGGGWRSTAVGQLSAFTNADIFKEHGSFTEYMDAFVNSISSFGDEIKKQSGWDSDAKGLDGFKKNIMRFANTFGGMLFAGLINKMGRPARYFANSLLTDAPVGLWHLMIGNPNAPIMSIGNLVLTGTEIEHSGPLGLDDFPTGLKVTCKFNRGKPRDQRGLEAMYMSGNDRIFHSMEGEIAKMYEASNLYKSESSKSLKDASPIELFNKNSTVKDTGSGSSPDQARQMKDVVKNRSTLEKFFGTGDPSTLILSAGEQGHGSVKAPKTEEKTQSQKY